MKSFNPSSSTHLSIGRPGLNDIDSCCFLLPLIRNEMFFLNGTLIFSAFWHNRSVFHLPNAKAVLNAENPSLSSVCNISASCLRLIYANMWHRTRGWTHTEGRWGSKHQRLWDNPISLSTHAVKSAFCWFEMLSWMQCDDEWRSFSLIYLPVWTPIFVLSQFFSYLMNASECY